MRRKDREVLNRETIEKIIDDSTIIRVGLFDGKYPYIVPLNYGYQIIDNNYVFFMHCATEGRKLDIIRNNPKVCFELETDCLVKEIPKACGWTMFFKSVMGTGTIEIIEKNSEKEFGLTCLMEHYDKNGKAQPYNFSPLINKTLVLKLVTDSISCKVKEEIGTVME